MRKLNPLNPLLFFYLFFHRGCLSFHMCSQLMSAVLLLLRLWESGTREMDNERSTQGTSAPLLPLLQRFQNIHSSKEEPINEEEAEVTVFHRTMPG